MTTYIHKKTNQTQMDHGWTVFYILVKRTVTTGAKAGAWHGPWGPLLLVNGPPSAFLRCKTEHSSDSTPTFPPVATQIIFIFLIKQCNVLVAFFSFFFFFPWGNHYPMKFGSEICHFYFFKNFPKCSHLALECIKANLLLHMLILIAAQQ